MDLVIFDLETTGLSPWADAIIQIAATRVSAGKVLHAESFSSFVNPGCPIPPFITSYTGISNAQVRNAPDVATALLAFSRFAGETVLVAHNGHRFDMPFIHEACSRHGLRTRPVRYTDSIYFSRRVWQGARRHGMDAVIQRLGITTEGFRRHDARGDVGLLAEAVVRMWRALDTACSELPAPSFPGVLPF